MSLIMSAQNGSVVQAKVALQWNPKMLDFILGTGSGLSLAGSELMVGWDAKETAQGSVDGFLVTNKQNADAWEIREKQVRSTHRLGATVIEYKDISNRAALWNALEPTLEAAAGIEGLLLVILTRKEVMETLEEQAKQLLARRVDVPLEFEWKTYELARALRIAGYVGYIASRFTEPEQDFNWRADRDNIFGNEQQKADLRLLLRRFHEDNQIHMPGRLGFGHYYSTGVLDVTDKAFSAIADLAVGAVHASVNEIVGDSSGPASYPSPVSGRRVSKEQAIGNWFWNKTSIPLRRRAIELLKGPNGDTALREVSMTVTRRDAE